MIKINLKINSMPKKLFNLIRDRVYSDFNENEQKVIIQDLITLLKKEFLD